MRGFAAGLVNAVAALALAVGAGPAAAGTPPCAGDVDGDRRVAVDELVLGVTGALRGCSQRPGRSCPGDLNDDAQITVDELIAAVERALQGCTPTAWWKGNLHTHSLWSDGDQYPEVILDWYKRAGYDFVTISDHNTLGGGERWLDVGRSRGGIEAYQAYLDRFGEDWVRARLSDGVLQALLTPIDECRHLLEEPGRFLVLPGEEITTTVAGVDSGRIPVHVNATNLVSALAPPSGTSVLEVLQGSIDAVLEQRRQTGQPMFPHVPHPNYRWAVTAADLAALRGERFFEVYNGHPLAWGQGDDTHPSVERLWDVALTERLLRGDPPLLALAVDDAHNYGITDPSRANPGRGWVMVRAPRLEPASLIAALEAGDFYASTGVTLNALRVGGGRLALRIREEPGVTYTTRFIGTRLSAPPADGPSDAPAVLEVGALLDEVIGAAAVYHLRGDELYVRATVVSSKRKANVAFAAEFEAAWIQPLTARSPALTGNSPARE